MLQETLKAKLIHTDDRREMERIGEEIMNAMPSRYDARTMGLMKAAVAKSMPDLLGDEADRYLKRTVYGYWVYGVTTKEWFYYDFENKTDEEKLGVTYHDIDLVINNKTSLVSKESKNKIAKLHKNNLHKFRRAKFRKDK